jgi:hypothetical protein
LLVGLVFLEATDIVFAVDSVPAIFAFTNEPLIVFTSNIFAILGLRALYFLLAGAVEKFHLLKYGLGTVLVFVGLKMVWLNELFDGKFPIGLSLGIIASVIASSVVLSLLFPRRDDDAKAPAKNPGVVATTSEQRPSAKRFGSAPPERCGEGALFVVPRLRRRPPKGGTPNSYVWKVVGFYLLILGLWLILTTALGE